MYMMNFTRLGRVDVDFTRGQFWPSGIVIACVCVCVCQSVCQLLACPCDNSGPVQARISKFGLKMQKTLVKAPIVLGQLTLTFKVKYNLKVRIYPIWACPHRNLLPIQARINKFGPGGKFGGGK